MAKNGATQPATAAEETFPLFFKKPVPVDSKRHAKAGLRPDSSSAYAKDTNSIAVNAVEFVEAAKYYPIIFTQGESVMPAVLVGLEQSNYYVDDKGSWKADTYIPAYVRKYPFIFMEVPAEKQFVLCVDEGASQFHMEAGKNDAPLYDGEKPAALCDSALAFCSDFQNHVQITRNFCEALVKADLLVPTQSDATLANGRAITLSGFQIINEEKLRALPKETVLDFHEKGWLPLIYIALMSSTNWQRLTNLASSREA